MTLYKSFEVKADEFGSDGGTITGYASTWDREPDSYGDIVAKGAFIDSLAKWAQREARIPFLYGHRTDDPKYNIGWCEAEEDEIGLKFTAYLDPESEKAQEVRKLYKQGRIFQFSFAYAVLDAAPVELEDGAQAYELRKLDLFEISAVQIPANQHAEVIDVKEGKSVGTAYIELEPRIKGLIDEQRAEFTRAISEAAQSGLEMGLKAGRRNSKADEDELQSVLDHVSAIQTIVSGLLAEQREEPDEQETETNPDEEQANAEEPDTANAEEPSAKAAEVDALLQQASELLTTKEG